MNHSRHPGDLCFTHPNIQNDYVIYHKPTPEATQQISRAITHVEHSAVSWLQVKSSLSVSIPSSYQTAELKSWEVYRNPWMGPKWLLEEALA